MADGDLARNLLSAVLALGFRDDVVQNEEAQHAFVEQAPQIRVMLEQHDVFALVCDGKPLDKFLLKLLQLLDISTDASMDTSNQTAEVVELKEQALELLLVMVEQSPVARLAVIYSQVLDRTVKISKYADREQYRLVAHACKVNTALLHDAMRHAPEVRRELLDTCTKLGPALLTRLGEYDRGSELSKDQVDLFANTMGFFSELLAVSPSSARSLLSKLEPVAVMTFLQATIAANPTAVARGAECLASIPNASDKANVVWKQIVDKVLESAHMQVDLVGGKRTTTGQSPTGMKAWLPDSKAASSLSALQQSQVVSLRLHAVTSVLIQCLQNPRISEREVQQTISDVLEFVRRTLQVRANSIGKQSAISEDGFRLPACVVYGVLPQFHEDALRVLVAIVNRSGLCALRHASRIARVLVVAAESVHIVSRSVFYDCAGRCVQALGAGTLHCLGLPVLDRIIEQCQQELTEDTAPKIADLVDNNKSRGRGHGKGKKRKRQLGDLSVLVSDMTMQEEPFLSTHAQRVQSQNRDAAVASLATFVSVYGSLLPQATRARVSDIVWLAVQHKRRCRFVSNAADPIVLLQLTDAVTADANGAHAANLIKNMDYWQMEAGASSVLSLSAQNVGEALLHPRAPPLSITIASYTHDEDKNDKTRRGADHPGKTVNGSLDWKDYEDEKHQKPDRQVEAEPMPVDQEATEDNHADKRQCVENSNDSNETTVVGKDTSSSTPQETQQETKPVEALQEEEEEEEEKEEDYEDARPIFNNVQNVAGSSHQVHQFNEMGDHVSTKVEAKEDTAMEDDEDDEFPDIVVDDDMDEDDEA